MLDIRRFRTEPDEVKAALARRGIDTSDVDVVVALDARQRQLAADRDDLRSRIKTLSKEVGRLRKEGLTAEAEASQAQSRELGDREQELADEAADVAEQVHQLLSARILADLAAQARADLAARIEESQGR